MPVGFNNYQWESGVKQHADLAGDHLPQMPPIPIKPCGYRAALNRGK